ncbi:putative integrase [Drosophila-associated adintovirus 1]|uniref:Integrase n=1 Tax=Drosophila-associated adintovirus 1 TaxID=2744816 RepID=A0A7D4VFA8_9VIRU|nr:putative integrase [Drosophila-associated adintovirus 1]
MSKIQVVSEIHKPARKNFSRRKFVQKGIDDTWQIDLVEMIPFYKHNDGYKYLLTIIDTFSKYSYAEPVKNKTASDIVTAIRNVFKISKKIPKNIQSDQGKEFFNKQFLSLMTELNINHYHTYTHLKASICERFNRTLKNIMWKMFSYQGNYRWVTKLPQLIHKYNNTYHRTIKMMPVDVCKRNEQFILQSVYNQPKIFPRHKYSVGDYVRISKYKGIFAKGYESSWTTEIFKIIKIKSTLPVTYLLKDYKNEIIKGSFYEEELQKVKDKNAYLVEKIIKSKNNKIFVKWLGFDDSHNSWIDRKNLLK